jgi:hypothetical protein
MELDCKVNTGRGLGPADHGFFYSDRSEFAVDIGVTYFVYAMVLFDHMIQVLVCNKFGSPYFCPIGLFEVSDGRIPADWKFGRREEGVDLPAGRWGLQAIWGYPEIVDSDAHYAGLVDRNPDDLKTFAAVRQRYQELTGRG